MRKSNLSKRMSSKVVCGLAAIMVVGTLGSGQLQL